MQPNLLQEYQSQYSQAKQRRDSLGERLNQIDQYVAQVGPEARGQILNWDNRPAGYNPLNDIASAIQFSEKNRDVRSAAQADYSSASRDSLSMLDAIGRERDRLKTGSNTNNLSAKELLDFQLRAAEKGLKLQKSSDGGYEVVADANQKLNNGLGAKEKTDVANYLSALKDIKDLNDKMSSLGADKTGYWGSLGQATTGPVAGTIGDYLPGQSDGAKQFRKALDTFSDSVRKDKYGSAFTETEKKIATLPSSKSQEAYNRDVLQSLYDSKKNQLVSRLRAAGLSQPEIDSYISTELGGASGGSNDPLGLFK